MIDKEKLINKLEDMMMYNIYPTHIQILINDLKNGRYDAKCIDTHDIDEYYKE